MKCSKCGATAKDIDGMRRHYLKHHPGAMKRKKKQHRFAYGSQVKIAKGLKKMGVHFCPVCGEEH